MAAEASVFFLDGPTRPVPLYLLPVCTGRAEKHGCPPHVQVLKNPVRDHHDAPASSKDVGGGGDRGGGGVLPKSAIHPKVAAARTVGSSSRKDWEPRTPRVPRPPTKEYPPPKEYQSTKHGSTKAQEQAPPPPAASSHRWVSGPCFPVGLIPALSWLDSPWGLTASLVENRMGSREGTGPRLIIMPSTVEPSYTGPHCSVFLAVASSSVSPGKAPMGSSAWDPHHCFAAVGMLPCRNVAHWHFEPT